jgi:predicted restriction endonuclease
MKETVPTNGELSIMFGHLMEKLDDFSDELKNNTKLTRDILVQFTAITTKVDAMEPLVMEYQENRDKVKGAIKFASITLIFLSGLFIYLAKSYIDYQQLIIANNVSASVYERLIKDFTIKIDENN